MVQTYTILSLLVALAATQATALQCKSSTPGVLIGLPEGNCPEGYTGERSDGNWMCCPPTQGKIPSRAKRFMRCVACPPGFVPDPDVDLKCCKQKS